MSQMRFAYAILPSVIVCLVEILKGRRLVIHIIITLIVITELFVYGSRGAFISIILLFVISVIYLKLSAIKKCLIIGSMLLCLFFLNYGVIVLERILDNTSIETPAFNRYRTFLKKGIVDSSSGRDEIYSKAWNMFSDSPILGCGIGYFPSKMNMDFTVRFVHNFFIQIFFEYGIILAIIIYSFLLSLMVKMYRNGDNVLVMNILVILLSVVCGRLMVSSSYWARPEFWLMLSYMWMYKKNRYTL
jgi:O-antigen ligase